MVIAIEPWGILLAVAGLVLSLFAWQQEAVFREEDRVIRAFEQFSNGHGRNVTWDILHRNASDLVAFQAPKAYLPEHNFDGLDLTRAVFTGANLGGSSFNRASLDFVDFTDANLVSTSFEEASLRGAKFTGIGNVFDVSFLGAELSSTSFEGLELRATSFRDASLHGANMKDTTIFSSGLNGANLKGANFLNASQPDDEPLDLLVIEGVQLCRTTLPNSEISNRDCGPLEF